MIGGLKPCRLKDGSVGIHMRTSRQGTPYLDRCLSKSQFATLFGPREKMPKVIGCGSSACAYVGKRPDRVVKLTTDKSDVASTIRAQGLPTVPTLYRYRRLRPHDLDARRRDPQWGYNLWAMELERVKPLVSPNTSDARMRELSHYLSCGYEEPVRCCTNLIVRRDGNLSECGKIAKGLRQVAKDLESRGLSSAARDFHVGNFGWNDRGQLVLLDLGVSSNRPVRSRTLHGARRRRK